jgi:hypothetical protein
MVKLAYKPIEDKAELERLLMNEKAVYDKFQPLTGWVIHRCYGEYLWYGGRAFVLSDEGSTSSDLTSVDFTTLGLEERCDYLWSFELFFLLIFTWTDTSCLRSCASSTILESAMGILIHRPRCERSRGSGRLSTLHVGH